NGYLIKGFAPSAEAAKVLGVEVGIVADTVASLLHSKLTGKVQSLHQIWIVDEAGLLSAKAAYELLHRATQENARVILVGDTRQLSAVEAGNPFKSLQAAGMTTAYMEQSLRQRTPHLQQAVDLIAKGEVEAGLIQLEQNSCIEQLPEESEKLKLICTDYLAIPPDERDRTLVLAGTNQERLEITQQIRAALKAEGSLGQTATLTQLKAKDLTSVQMKYTHNFEIGDAIVPIKNYKRRGLEKGKLYQVVDKTKDTLTLKDEAGVTVTVDPLFEKAVYSQSYMEIAEGDRLKWTKNDRKLGKRNGQEFRVVNLQENTALIEDQDGRQEQINLGHSHHLDYAIVSTTYSAQGKTADRVLISA
ncbi:MAG: AAA family ATPase, partial [Microcystaceae cyanobacterium]